jgi:hypothetical protein
MAMAEEDREKLCADLRDPWAVTIEELAELAGVAAGEIERLAKELERERDTAPASVVRWWARSKRARAP